MRIFPEPNYSYIYYTRKDGFCQSFFGKKSLHILKKIVGEELFYEKWGEKH
jgi:hypothetical protein